MVIDKKTSVEVVILTGLFVIIFLFSQYQKVKIIYFTNPRCLVAQKIDGIIDEIKDDFVNKIRVKEIIINMYPDDIPDTEDVKQLRDEYQVYGTPDIIINGKKFTKKYTKDNLEEEICKKFLIKPEVCWLDEE